MFKNFSGKKKSEINKSFSDRNRSVDSLPDVALAAIASYKKQSEITTFITFLLDALERNTTWLNSAVGKQIDFKCAMFVGAGPNRFRLLETIYPSNESYLRLEVEHRNSDDYDKIAVAAILKLSTAEMENLVKYTRTRLHENMELSEELVKGKDMGISYAVLRPFTEKVYRMVERIPIDSSLKCLIPAKRRKRETKIL